MYKATYVYALVNSLIINKQHILCILDNNLKILIFRRIPSMHMTISYRLSIL
jgi:hypothetical protein